MKILVTGGAGFIGSHVAEAFQAAGEVHVLDDCSSGRPANLPSNIPLHQFDVRDEAVAQLMAAEQFDVLVHHAAQMDVRRSVADPSFDADVNARGFLNVMEAGRQNGLKKVLFASTGGAIYGEPEYVPQDEAHPAAPLSPYGITKLVTEKYLHFYNVTYGIDYVALRYANVYGPRQNPHGEAGVVAIFCRRMLAGQQAVVYGDGLQTRDYVFVGDVVRANQAALAYAGSGIFNIGTGKETTVNTLYDHLNELTGNRQERQHEPARPGEQKRSVLDTSLAAKELNWVPQKGLREGLADTLAWFDSPLSRG